MSEGVVLIEGKEYVSSERAAKLVGYTKDYVGQLARAGKIESKKIGRSWYISQDSITKHKLSVHYILTKPKKPLKNKTENDEIANVHIDKIVTPQKSNVQNYSNTNNSNVDENKGFMHEDEEDFDLLPRLKEKNRDVLLHTDIRYEEEVSKVPERKQIPEQAENTRHIKSIPIRKPEKKIYRDRSRTFQGGTRINRLQTRNAPQQVDGIRVDGIRRVHDVKRADNVVLQHSNKLQQTPAIRRTNTTQQLRKVRTAQMQEEYTNDEQEQNKTSKVVPVVGAIIVFTIFAVIYIFLSA